MIKGFRLIFIPGEGDPKQIIRSKLEENVRKVLAENGAFLYNDGEDPFRNYFTGVVCNEKKSTDLHESIDAEGISEGQS